MGIALVDAGLVALFVSSYLAFDFDVSRAARDVGLSESEGVALLRSEGAQEELLRQLSARDVYYHVLRERVIRRLDGVAQGEVKFKVPSRGGVVEVEAPASVQVQAAGLLFRMLGEVLTKADGESGEVSGVSVYLPENSRVVIDADRKVDE